MKKTGSDRLFKFQRTGVDFLKTHNRALLADDMGLGKTIQAIVAAKEQGLEKILVLCPASVKYNWEREIKDWWPEMKTFVAENSKVKLSKFPRIIIINYDIIHKKQMFSQLAKTHLDLLICDEAHYLKNPRAKRTKIVFMKNALSYWSDRTWLLTGTPVLNRPVELFPALRALIPQKLGKYTDYMAFTKKFCAGYKSRWGWDARGASNLDQLSKYLNNFMLRRRKTEVLKDLPDKTHQKIIFKPDRIAKKLVKEERKHFKKTKENMLGEYATARHDLGVRKIPLMLEYIENVLKERDKIVVFAYHREVIQQLYTKLHEYGPRTVYGSMPAQVRKEHLHDFITRKDKRVFIGQIDAAGTGIDGLQKVCDYALFAEISWVPGQLRQAIDRLHRIGQDNKVLIQFLVIKNSIDEDILDSLIFKTKVIKKLMKGGANAKKAKEKEPVQNYAKTKKEKITKRSVKMYIEEMLTEILGRVKAIEQMVDSGSLVDKEREEKKTASKKKKSSKKQSTKKKKKGMTADALLEYCNDKIVPLENKSLAKDIVNAVKEEIEEKFDVKQLKSLTDSDEIEQAKKLFDKIYAEKLDEADEDEEDATL